MVLRGLQQWGDKYLPHPGGPGKLRRVRGTGRPVHVGFVDEDGGEISLADLDVVSA